MDTFKRVENFSKNILITVNITELIRNRTSFEIGIIRLLTDKQNKSKFEERTIVTILDRPINSNTPLDFKNLEDLFPFISVDNFNYCIIMC